MNEKTDKSFWEKYWATIKLPVVVNRDFKNDRIIADCIKKHIPDGDGNKNAIEIGCAPGKWLIFLNQEMHYRVDGYEYVETAAEKTFENLKMNNVDCAKGKIVVGDFTKEPIEKKYDLVLSLGFVEHFENIEEILDRHLNIVKPSGYLAIGVPHFRGITWLYQFIIDLLIRDKILPGHNSKAMQKSTFLNYARKKGIEKVFIDYVGGFETGLFFTSRVRNKMVRLILGKVIGLTAIVAGDSNSPIVSSYLMCVFRKPL